MPIPILRLPFLALIVVIDCGEDVEILSLSLCSRKSDRAVNVCRKNLSVLNSYGWRGDIKITDRFNNLEILQLLLSEAGKSDNKERLAAIDFTHLCVGVSNVLALEFQIGSNIKFTLNIDFKSQMERYNGYKKYLNIKGISVPFVFSDNLLYTYWDDRAHGLQFFTEYFETNFRLKRSSWEFNNAVPDFLRLTSYLNSMPYYRSDNSTIVETVTVERDAKLSHEEYTYLLETVKADFNGYMETSDDFKFASQFSTETLDLEEAHWFTFDHLLECNCKNVEVRGSKITNRQLKSFVERVMSGEVSHFDIVELELDEEVDSILTEILRENEFRRLRNTRRIDALRPPRYLIYGENGERAVIQCRDKKFTLRRP